jgi:chemotaxis response regulator CheB
MAQTQQHSIVVIGASNGGLEALIEIVGGMSRRQKNLK